jgi:hypothetical protein
MSYIESLIVMLAIFGVFAAMAIIYLSSLFEFVRKIRKEDEEYWNNIGQPNNIDITGQAVILGLVFIPNRLPHEKSIKYKKLIYRIRVSAALGLISFASAIVMLKLGLFVQLN